MAKQRFGLIPRHDENDPRHRAAPAFPIAAAANPTNLLNEIGL
jgi:hypothetical protein